MKVAVVGPTGVLGKELVPLLLQRGHHVRACARSLVKAHALFPQVPDMVECDLLSSNAGALASMLDGCEAVMHIATAIPRDMNAPGAWDVNTRLRTDGVRTLLDASLQAGVKRYLQQSITMAYPDRGDKWITEDIPLDSSPERARTSAPVIAMEQMVRNTPLEKMEWCILRGGSFVGKDTFQDTSIARLRSRKEIVPCGGRNYVSLIHVADIAAAFVAALENAPAGSIFNIVAEPLRNGEYLDRLAASIGASTPPRDAATPCPPSWRCSNRTAKTMLQWNPVHGLIPES